MNFKSLLQSWWSVKPETDFPKQRNQSGAEIPPLENHATVHALESHATIHRDTADSGVLGTEDQIHGMAPSLSATSLILVKNGSRREAVESVLEDTTARESSSRVLSSYAMSQGRERSNRPLEDDYEDRYEVSGKDVVEDERQDVISLLAERSRNFQGQKQLNIKVAETQATRLALRERRATWRSRQEEMHNIVAQLMRKLDNIGSSSADDLKAFVIDIREHYQTLQEARSAVALEEHRYERIESMLIRQENDLQFLESRSRRRSAATSEVTSEDQRELLFPERDPTESVVSSQNIRRNNSAEARRYLSQKGDVDLIRDQLMDLEVYHSQVIEEQNDRREAGLAPDEALTAFLENFDNEHHTLAMRLQDAEKSLADYKEALQEPDDSIIPDRMLDRKHPTSQTRDRGHSLFSEEELPEDEYFSKIEDTKFAATAKAFHSPNADSSEVYKLLNISSDGSVVDKSSYINSWMLHHLRQSPGEIVRLASEHERHGLHLDPHDFEQNVLAHWLKDETVHAFEFPRFAAKSHDLSMATASGNAQNSRAASENAHQAERYNSVLLKRRLSARHTQTEL